MGNECCDEYYTKDQQMNQKPVIVALKNTAISSNLHSSIDQPNSYLKKSENLDNIQIPELAPQISSILDKKKPFNQQINSLESQFKKARFNGEIYYGIIENGLPESIGRLYRRDGNHFIGHFKKGLAEGHGIYITKQGVVYEGDLAKNKITCTKGLLESFNFVYEGGFLQNNFHGNGKQKTDNFEFEGIYEHGKKKQGKQKWTMEKIEYSYEGSFNKDEKFEGKGILKQELGEYQGQFINGEKSGAGVYRYNSGLIYEGQYIHNQREGKGKLINADNTLAYQGEFKSGMPNGKGRSVSFEGVTIEGNWIEGMLEQAIM